MSRLQRTRDRLVTAFLRYTEAFWRQTEVPSREVFFDLDAQYGRIVWLLRAHYVWLLYFALTKWTRKTYFEPAPFDPMWPVFWMRWVPWEAGAWAIVGLCIGGAAASLLMPRRQLPRILAAVGLFEALALTYTYTGVQHRTYTMLALTCFYALIPTLRDHAATLDEKRRSLLAVFGGVSFVLFTYSWAGFTKLWGLTEALLRGDAHVLDFGRVPVVFLNRAFRFEHPPPMSEFVLDHPVLASLGLFLVMYVEFVSLSVAFRPHLQRWWMFLLAGFHLSTLLTMRVYFAPATAMLLVLGIFTPFARFEGWRPILRELPGIGPLLLAGLVRLEGGEREPRGAYGGPGEAP